MSFQNRNLSNGRSRGVDLPPSWPNMNSQMFRCGHHRGLFALHNTNNTNYV